MAGFEVITEAQIESNLFLQNRPLAQSLKKLQRVAVAENSFTENLNVDLPCFSGINARESARCS
jgi:hypothetical protein